MIQFLADQLDQMDLALDQLAMRDRNLDRFAIMLIDNVVELALHTHAENLSYTIDYHSQLGKKSFNKHIVKEALGQQFDRKIKLAKISEMVQPEICDSIGYLHSFRNTAYHSGRRHEGILHSLAIFYFKIACTVLKEFRPFVWSSCSSDKISIRAMKYIGNMDFMGSKENFSSAWSRMMEIAEAFEDTLVSDLHADMDATITTVDNAVEYLIENDAGLNGDRQRAIINVQACALLHTAAADSFLQSRNAESSCNRKNLEYLIANFNWTYKTDPIASWKSRLKSLSNEKCPHKALKKYCDFHTQTEQIRLDIREAAFQLDLTIQDQIDRYLDK